VLGLVALELGAISLLYTNNFDFTCRAAAPAPICAALSLAVVRAVLAGAVLTLFAAMRPARLAELLAVRSGRVPRAWLALQLAGAALVLAPWAFLGDASGGGMLALGFISWAVGGAAAAIGMLGCIAPLAAWARFLWQGGAALGLALAGALVAPEIAALAQSAWGWSPVTDLTFAAVVGLLDALGAAPVSDPAIHLIGADGFRVRVGPQCSGVEGFALISAFTLGYLAVFRRELRFPAAWILLPLGLLLSWCFNVGRIALLILIGAHVSPDLAIGGFHSHAGWLMFSALAVGMLLVASALPGLGRDDPGVRPPPPLLADRNAAEILPFAAMMGTGLLLSTISEAPALLYPVKAAAMAVALWLFLPLYRRLAWRADPLSLALGAGVGVAWVAAGLAADRGGPVAAELAALSGAGLALWSATRIAGTVLLVPLAEELFFRGYLMRRLGRGGWAMPLVAVAISAGLFALLHERWLLALAAGLIYGALVLRSGRVTDAVQAHALSNAVIALAAAITGQWALI